ALGCNLCLCCVPYLSSSPPNRGCVPDSPPATRGSRGEIRRLPLPDPQGWQGRRDLFAERLRVHGPVPRHPRRGSDPTLQERSHRRESSSVTMTVHPTSDDSTFASTPARPCACGPSM